VSVELDANVPDPSFGHRPTGDVQLVVDERDAIPGEEGTVDERASAGLGRPGRRSVHGVEQATIVAEARYGDPA
jgi:hypothetical protein